MRANASYNSLVLKIGTNVLTHEDGKLDIQVIQAITDQIATLHKKGVRILVVSSGAVGAGKELLPNIKASNKIEQRQVHAAIGQSALMKIYASLFEKKKIKTAQVLLTKSDFKDRHHYLNIRRCLDALWKNGVVPIINENDAVSVNELMFTDNDELAGLLSSMINADALVLATNVEGLFTGSPDDPTSKLLATIQANEDITKYVKAEKSAFGRGGMLTKIKIAQKSAQFGAKIHIVNGKTDNFLTKVCKGEQIGTKIEMKVKKKNSIKKWLAFSDTKDLPIITIDKGLTQILKKNQSIVSILPIGIKKITGNFEKGDMVRILDEKSSNIGMGLAEYSSATAQRKIGKKGARPLIHYNNLHIA